MDVDELKNVSLNRRANSHSWNSSLPYKESNQTVTSIKVQLLQHFSEFNFCKVYDYSILCFIFHATLLQIPFLGLMSLTKCLMLYYCSILIATLSHHDFKSWYELSSTFAKYNCLPTNNSTHCP